MNTHWENVKLYEANYSWIMILSNYLNLNIKKQGKLIIGINLAMETSYIKTILIFPILV